MRKPPRPAYPQHYWNAEAIEGGGRAAAGGGLARWWRRLRRRQWANGACGGATARSVRQ